ncbi:hypothetical protein ElyMa_002358500 [Elysia marginata]|uniref:Uncharacterized protein n=1 Tax=Elysia marginata TaxID=1093978 RepID=A0AAV4G958_9GAST|nr:hypothetical protein ElyMa_002358500 [Elysia marginata]
MARRKRNKLRKQTDGSPELFTRSCQAPDLSYLALTAHSRERCKGTLLEWNTLCGFRQTCETQNREDFGLRSWAFRSPLTCMVSPEGLHGSEAFLMRGFPDRPLPKSIGSSSTGEENRDREKV